MVTLTSELVAKVEDRQNKRNYIALEYAHALSSQITPDWPVVNAAIKARWSMSGLRYVKDRAWKWVNQWRGKQGGSK